MEGAREGGKDGGRNSDRPLRPRREKEAEGEEERERKRGRGREGEGEEDRACICLVAREIHYLTHQSSSADEIVPAQSSLLGLRCARLGMNPTTRAL